MRICVNHNFERRIGIWPAGWDEDGELFCNQRYGDWPYAVEEGEADPWRKPEWMLLSYKRSAKASSSVDGKEPAMAVDENVRTWWRAADGTSGQWLEVDLGKRYDVHAIQVNFADDGLEIRYIRLTVIELPYGQTACVSGLRVFGLGDEPLPEKAAKVTVKREDDLDVTVSWQGNAVGYVAEWGYRPDKLYHSYQVFGNSVHIGGLIKGQDLYIRVDSFNENGITEGETIRVE